MFRLPSVFVFLAVLPAVVSAHSLPHVNPARTVSAMELYGVAPTRNYQVVPPETIERDFIVSTPTAGTGEIHIGRASAAGGSGEMLIPNRPAGDLWTQQNDPPLRMPNPVEYRVISLPEERLGNMPNNRFAGASTTTPASGHPFASEGDLRRNTGGNQRIVGVQQVARPTDMDDRNFFVSAPPPLPIIEEAPAPDGLERVVAAPVRTQGGGGHIRSVPRVEHIAQAPAAASGSFDRDAIADEFRYQGEVPLSRLSPSELRRAFQRTFTSENRHLSTYRVNDGFDDVSFTRSARVDTGRMASEEGGVRPLEIKISFDGGGSSLTRDTYNLLAEYAGLVAANPQRAVQISISERSTRSFDGRKLAARRLAIIEQVLKDSGVIDKRIIPVLSQRNDDAFVLRVISSEMFHTLTERRRDMFGEETAGRTQRSLAW